MKRLVEYIVSALMVLLTGKSVSLVDAGLVDYSGQGRDRYGR